MDYRSLFRGHLRWRSSLPLIIILLLIPFWLGAVNCVTQISVGLGPDCTAEVTAASLLSDANVDPDDVTVILTYGNGIVIQDNILRLKHVGRAIKAQLICNGGTCAAGSCWTNIEVQQEVLPTFGEMLDTVVYCFDSLLFMDPGASDYPLAPSGLSSCSSFSGPFFAADWIDVNLCEDSDTAKYIYREWYALSKDGNRVVSFDTIAVLRLPPIDMAVNCPPSDTTYCDGEDGAFGPYLLVDQINGMGCDTLYLLELAELLENGLKCDLRVKIDRSPFDTDCGEVTAYDISLVQTCALDMTNCSADEPLQDFQTNGDDIFATCSFWHMVLDTTPPNVKCLAGRDSIRIGDTLATIVSATGEDCSAHIYLPDAEVADACSDARHVKARIDSVGTIKYEKQSDGLWGPTERIRLPYQSEPYQVVIEARDSCHNLSTDTCYLIIKDRTRPTAVAHDSLTVTIYDDKVWLNPESFDNGSLDNCSDLRYLVRRADWKTFCVTTCDATERIPTIIPDDSIDCASLKGTLVGEIESHYLQYLEWLRNDGVECDGLLANAWQYALCEEMQVECMQEVDAADFPDFYAEKFGVDNVEELAQLGGGWTESVPIGPQDRGTSVIVELLVMDYWCNWSVSWSRVHVKERIITRSVAQDQGDLPHTQIRQAYPNPFKSISTIEIQLAEATSVDLIITAIDGRQVHHRSSSYSAGVHPLMVRREDLGGSGIYYYRVIAATGEHKDGKLVLLE